MAAAIERVQNHRTLSGSNPGIEVPHVGGKQAAQAQYLRITGRERERSFVFLMRPRKVEGSGLEYVRKRQVPLGQSRGERDRLACIACGLRVAIADRRPACRLPGVGGERDRSAREREREVRIQLDCFRVCDDRGGYLFLLMPQLKRLRGA